jgi:2'-hydroxyisoflavone reductase
MNLLIIGGGVFLGQALLSSALENGHTVTVFNRGQSRQWWPPGVKWIVGDRKEDLHLLMNRQWDAVIDTCGYRPQDVELSCAALYDYC